MENKSDEQQVYLYAPQWKESMGKLGQIWETLNVHYSVITIRRGLKSGSIGPISILVKFTLKNTP